MVEEGRDLVPSQMWHAFYVVGSEGSDLHNQHCIIPPPLPAGQKSWEMGKQLLTQCWQWHRFFRITRSCGRLEWSVIFVLCNKELQFLWNFSAINPCKKLRYRRYISGVGWDWITVSQGGLTYLYQSDILEVKRATHRSNRRSLKSGKIRTVPWEWRKSKRKKKNATRKCIEMNCLGYATKFCLSRSCGQDMCLCMCKGSYCCEVNVIELVSLKKTLVSDVFGKSCKLLMWYVGQRKKCSCIKGFLILCLNVKRFSWNERSEDWLWSASLQAIWIWIVQFFIIYFCFAGTFSDLTAGILYTINVSSVPDTLSAVKLEFLDYHFGSNSRSLGSTFFDTISYLMWQLTVQTVVLVMLSGYRDLLSQKDMVMLLFLPHCV